MQARRILEELKSNRVTHVVGLPDNSSAALFDLLAGDRDIRLVPVTREGEAFAIAAGIWIGGGKPVVLVQNTGFFESGDGFRGTITRMRVPLVCLITYRGYRKLSKDPAENTLDAVNLSRPQLDSAALITEPTLAAWGMPYDFLHQDRDARIITEAFCKSAERDQPFAVLITADLR
jgi:thiamine pyrophosphate-dependent acetolactate synthase large subunit-like protein